MMANNPEIVLGGMARTPMGKLLGSLSVLKAPQLGGAAIKAAVARSGVKPEAIDGVIMGHVCPAGIGQAPARQALLAAGLPPEVAALTVNKVCGSGMISVVTAAQQIKAGDAQVVVAGGQESMSNIPHYLYTLRTGIKLGHGQLVDGMIYDGIWCALNDVHMGMLAEFTAERSGITRQMQDEWAVGSNLKSAAAIKDGKFKAEIAPVEIAQKKGPPKIVDTDEGPRPDSTLEAMAKLSPAFKRDGGTVTAANASQISDGAAAMVVMARETAAKLGANPMARILGYAIGSLEPKMLFYAPVKAVRRLTETLGIKVNDFDLIEINEAFAAQTLAGIKDLGIDTRKVNVNGGAVALGHPIGASGARILVTLAYALKDRGLKKGLAAICLGGGEAVAMALELV
jgi:acetyl-CoA C-acetyltransferase